MNDTVAQNRRIGVAQSLAAVGLVAMPVWAGCIGAIGGAFKGQPENIEEQLSPQAKELVNRAFSDMEGADIVDYHAHIVGLGDSSGSQVNGSMLSWRHPFKRGKARVYLSACGITDERSADAQYVPRLVRPARGFGQNQCQGVLCGARPLDPAGPGIGAGFCRRA